MEKVFEIYIKTTPERLWEAITDPELRAKYNFGVGVELGLVAGLELRVGSPAAGIKIAAGENLEVEPPRRLVQSFNALWSDDVQAQGTSRVTWEIEPVGDSCQLTVTHDQLPESANPELYGGWPMILSGLKTLLETGEELTTPGSLRYSGAEAWSRPHCSGALYVAIDRISAPEDQTTPRSTMLRPVSAIVCSTGRVVQPSVVSALALE